MSVPWEYLPVRIVARLGQHSGSTTKPFVNETPLSMRAECTPGIESSSHRWSSVRISTMFGCTVKLVALAAVPSGVVTVTGPVRAPRGTVAVICVSESTWNVAWTSLKATADASVKFAPVITIETPIVARSGSKPLMTGEVACATDGTPTRATTAQRSTPLRNAERLVISTADQEKYGREPT